MKKRFKLMSVIMILALVMSALPTISMAAVTSIMYDQYGKRYIVLTSDVEKYKAMGWYLEPFTKMYAADGRTKSVAPDMVEANKKVGWYLEPVTKMYAADGRTKYVEESKIEANKKVGWYLEPVTKMYAPDGRTKYVEKSKVEANKKVGWHLEPFEKLYALDGRTKYVKQSNVEAYKKVGWYDVVSSAIIEVDANVKKYGYQKAISIMEEKYLKHVLPKEEYLAVNAKREKLIKEWYKSTGTPLVIDSYKLDTSSDEPILTITYRNISGKTIVAFDTTWTCLDAYSEPIQYFSKYSRGHMEDITYSTNFPWNVQYHLSGAQNSNTSIKLDKNQTKKIRHIGDMMIRRLAFEDGTTWYNPDHPSNK